MSMTPPQVSPTANASSSATPYLVSFGIPDATTSPASSYTAPSTHPPDTLPATDPCGPTTIAAPGALGADLNVPTTVANPAGSPADHHSCIWSSSSRTSHLRQQLLQRGKAVAGEQPVEVGQRGEDARLDRLVAGAPGMRVEPEDAVGEPRQPPQLLTEQRGVAALPAVRTHHHDRPPRHAPLAPAVQEDLDGLTQPGAARPVRHRARRRGQRLLRVALPQLPADPGEPGADREHLGRHPTGHRVGEPQQRIGVRAHRAGH